MRTAHNVGDGDTTPPTTHVSTHVYILAQSDARGVLPCARLRKQSQTSLLPPLLSDDRLPSLTYVPPPYTPKPAYARVLVGDLVHAHPSDSANKHAPLHELVHSASANALFAPTILWRSGRP